MPITRLTDTERRLAQSAGAHQSWANTEDRTKRTEAGRKALEDRFLREAGGDPKRAESLRRAYFTRLSLKAAQARRARKQAASQEVSAA